MRTRTLGRSIGQLVAVAAFGAGATLGIASVAAADDSDSGGSATTGVPTVLAADDGASPHDYVWD